MQASPSTSSSAQQDRQLRAQLELLQEHHAPDRPADTRETNGDSHHYSPDSQASNGYDNLEAASRDASRVLDSKPDADQYIHPELRARDGFSHAAEMMPIAAPSGHSPGHSAGPSAPPMAPVPQLSADPMDPTGGDGRKAKRELSQSKRAAQNRAAQRAFRQRKEGYIKKLEQQVREFMDMEQSFKGLQQENYSLREYVLHLQSRLMDANADVPNPPANVNLSQAPPPPPPAPQHDNAAAVVAAPPPPASLEPAGAGTPLEAVAQAVAGLAAHEQMQQRQESYPSPTMKHEDPEELRTSAEEIAGQASAA